MKKRPLTTYTGRLSPEQIQQVKALLGVDKLPLNWSEKDLHNLKVRSRSSLQRDRWRKKGLPSYKEEGCVNYPVLLVLEHVFAKMQEALGTGASFSRKEVKRNV